MYELQHVSSTRTLIWCREVYDSATQLQKGALEEKLRGHNEYVGGLNVQSCPTESRGQLTVIGSKFTLSERSGLETQLYIRSKKVDLEPTDTLTTPRNPIGMCFELEFSAVKRPEWCRIYTCIKILEVEEKSTNDST